MLIDCGVSDAPDAVAGHFGNLQIPKLPFAARCVVVDSCKPGFRSDSYDDSKIILATPQAPAAKSGSPTRLGTANFALLALAEATSCPALARGGPQLGRRVSRRIACLPRVLGYARPW